MCFGICMQSIHLSIGCRFNRCIQCLYSKQSVLNLVNSSECSDIPNYNRTNTGKYVNLIAIE